MAYKHTVALIGATSTTGTFIARRLADRHRLVLMDSDPSQLLSLQESIVSQDNRADIDVLNCCKDASWEADTVIICIDDQALDTIADRIKDVTTCKTVVQFTTTATSRLPQLLPHARVTTVVLTAPLSDAHPNQVSILYGPDETARQTTDALLDRLGCVAQYA